MDGWLKWMLGTALLLVTLVIGLSWGIYACGASLFPANIDPNPYQAPANVQQQYLRTEAGDVSEIPKLNPLKAGWYLFRSASKDGATNDHAFQLLGQAAQALQLRAPIDTTTARRHANSIAGVVYISRNWSLPDVVNTLIGESGYGRGAKGIETASVAYFGLPLAQLRPEETLALIVLLKGPAYYDPVCNQDRFAKRYSAHASRLNLESGEAGVAKATSRILPVICET